MSAGDSSRTLSRKTQDAWQPSFLPSASFPFSSVSTVRSTFTDSEMPRARNELKCACLEQCACVQPKNSEPAAAAHARVRTSAHKEGRVGVATLGRRRQALFLTRGRQGVSGGHRHCWEGLWFSAL